MQEVNLPPFTVKEADDTSKGHQHAGPGNFKYVGSTFSGDGQLFREIALRVQAGWTSFAKFKQSAWNVKALSNKLKGRIWQAAVLPAVMYGLGARALAPRHIKILQRFQDACVRQILHISRQDQHDTGVPMSQLLNILGIRSMHDYCVTEILRHAGHTMRLDNSRIPKKCLFAWHPARETDAAIESGTFHSN